MDGNNVVEYSNRTNICTFNDNCNLINHKVVSLLSGDLKEYCSTNSVIMNHFNVNDSFNFFNEKIGHPMRVLESITPARMLPYKLILFGANVMLMRNMNLSSGSVACLMVGGSTENAVNLEVLTGLGRGNIVFSQ